MFELYNEKARRVIFFARYEASTFGSPYIETEHFLLGLFREDKELVRRFLPSRAVHDEIQKQIEEQTAVREKLSTSVDLPISAEVRRVLAFAEEEGAARGLITTAHLLLGLLRLEDCFATKTLHRYGLFADVVRQQLQGSLPAGSVKQTHSKPTACRDCKHLIIDGSSLKENLNLYCGASPQEPRFDCYTGEFKSESSGSPSERFRLCMLINSGECRLFEPK
jgi:ATP-dependent Clp protease ATP-binding subunit ClpA